MAQCGAYSESFQYYEDHDLDGEGDIAKEVQGCIPCLFWDLERDANRPAPKCVLNSTDCMDNNANVTSTTYYYLDNDGDGYYTQTWRRSDQNVGSPEWACRDNRWRVQGLQYTIGFNSAFYGNNTWSWVLKGPGDCNDNNPFIHPETVWYKDKDKDGWFTESTKSCTKPGTDWYHAGENINQSPYAAYNLGDCDDTNPAIYQQLTYYPDVDGDGYRGSEVGISGCQPNPPAGYITYNIFKKEIDVDDNNAAVYRSGTFYKDEDNDWYLAGPFTVQYGATEPVGNLPANSPSRGTDCDDHDFLLKGSMLALVDADNDNYAGSLTPVNVCFSDNSGNIYLPQGYVLISENQGLDCDDNNNFYKQQQYYYKDVDGDGYVPVGYDSVLACTPPNGYGFSSLQYDCDDNNASAFAMITAYLDADGDGVPALKSNFCSGGSLPPGYTASIHYSVVNSNLIDVDDNNPAVYFTINIYVDGDGDKYPKDLNQPIPTQVGDGYTTPAGYVSTRDNIKYVSDCNDNNASTIGGTVFFVDNDHDGVGSNTVFTICPATNIPPLGYSNAKGDCDDNDAATQYSMLWYFDNDNDGSPNGVSSYIGCNRPLGTKKKSELTNPFSFDCDDNNPNIYSNNLLYPDFDNDGYSTGENLPIANRNNCAEPGYKRADQLISITGDCNDFNAAYNPGAALAVWYQDADGDGFGNPSVSLTQCPAPVGYVADNTDCNDGNPNINPNSDWLKDYDNDNLTDGVTIVNQCARPTNFKLASELTPNVSADCNDSSASVTSPCSSHPEAYWLRDDDGDGYTIKPNIFGDYNRVIAACAPGCNWVCAMNCSGTSKKIKGYSDCNDQDPNIQRPVTFYIDADGDGYPSGTTSLCSLTPPNSTYKTALQLQSTATDCNDNDVNIKSGIISGNTYYRDFDGDGFGDANTSIKDCSTPVGYVSSNTDCNDAQANINQNTIWFRDADNDNYTDSATFVGCVAPSGYKLFTALASSAKDCNDNNSLINPASKWYKDLDGDLVSDGTFMTQCSRPANHKLLSELISADVDCNDGNATIKDPYLWYKDADNDGYTDGTTTKACTKPSNYKDIAELTSPINDCDDANASINPGSAVGVSLWYEDKDDDGFGDPNASMSYCRQPVGYVSNSSDCNDTDSTISPNNIWYKDADGDGYSDGGVLVQCEKPSGYVKGNVLKITVDTTLIPSSTAHVLHFDGINDYAYPEEYAPNIPIFYTSNYSYEVWTKWEGGDAQVIFSNGSTKGINVYINSSGKYTISHMGTANYASNVSAEIGKWTHIALTRTTTTSTLYINGDTAVSTTTNAQNPDHATYIGSLGGINYFFKGAMDEFRAWNRALTQAEILANMNKELTGNETDLHYYFTFNQGIPSGDNSAITFLTDKSTATISYRKKFMLAPVFGKSGSTSNFISPGPVGAYTISSYIDTVNVAIIPSTGQALDFDGTNDFVVATPPLSTVNNNFTVEFWAKWSGTGNSRQVLLSNGFSTGYNIQILNGQYLFSYMGVADYPTSVSAVAGKWTHFALTRNATTSTFYIDGVSVATTSGNPGIPNTATYIGAFQGSNFYFKGVIDEFRMWNRALTISEVNANKNLEISNPTSGLTVNFNFNQGIASGNNSSILALSDVSGNNKTATLNGFAKASTASNFVSPGAIPKTIQAFGGDCNDNDPNQYKAQVWYKDADNDNYSDGTTYTNCHDSVGFKPAYALIALTGDCDDSNAIVYPNVSWFKDADGDGFTSGNKLTQCTKPVGYVRANNLKEQIDTTITPLPATAGVALNFDGVNDYLASSPSPLSTATSNFTVEFWAKWSGTGNTRQVLLSNGTSSGYNIQILNGKYLFSIAGVQDYTTTISAIAGQWTHIALTRNATTSTLYIDGVSAATSTATPGVPNTATYIGSYGGSNFYFNGSIDEFRVWNKSLTLTEINNRKNTELTGAESNLVNYFSFNQGIAGGNNTAISQVNDKASVPRNLNMIQFAKTGTTSNFVNPGAVAAFAYSYSNIDCDDNNSSYYPNRIWYRDYDSDTLGDPLEYSIACSKPIGYVSNNLDDDDSIVNVGGAPKIVIKGNNEIIPNRSSVARTTNQSSFGTVCLNDANSIHTFTIFNTGTKTLDLHQVALLGDDANSFKILDAVVDTVAVGASQSVRVSFGDSLTTGLKNTKFYVRSSDAAEPIYFFTISANLVQSDSIIIRDTICAGDSYAFQGNSYSASGSYSVAFQNQHLCDSVVTLKLHVLAPDSTLVLDTICSGQSYVFNGSSYTASGTYSVTLQNSRSCDSTVTLKLHVNNSDLIIVKDTICSGQSYLFQGTSYTSSGTYSVTFQNQNSCDSIVTLNLVVLNPDSTVVTDTICSGESYLFHGTSYTASGNYSVTLQNRYSCDSTVTLKLHVHNALQKSSIRGKVLKNSVAVTEGEVILLKLSNIPGVVPVYIDTVAVSSGNYNFTEVNDGEYAILYQCGVNCNVVPTYYGGSFQYQLSSAIQVIGCPDFVVSDLDIAATPVSASTIGAGSIAGSLADGAVPPANVPDVLFVLVTHPGGEAIQYTYSDANGSFLFGNLNNGQYKVIADIPGYKSDTTHVYTVGGASGINVNASHCIRPDTLYLGVCNVVTETKSEQGIWEFTAYPNPTSGIVMIQTNFPNLRYKVYSSLGMLVESKEMNGYTGEIDLGSYANGIYVIQLIHNSKIKEIKVILE